MCSGYLAGSRIAVNITAFWRPALYGCPNKHYHPAANRPLPAMIVGILGEVGELNEQRIALPRGFIRVDPHDGGETHLWQRMLHQVQTDLQADELVVMDAWVKITTLHTAKIRRPVVRLATNYTARRNFLPEHQKGRKPTYGAPVRPLLRQRKGKTLAATLPDERFTWQVNDREIRAEVWRNLVLPKTVPSPNNQAFDGYAIYDPLFAQPWLLTTPLKLQPESVGRSIRSAGRLSSSP